MALINYNDKQFLNENASIPAENKVSDTDMNEIKNVVNNNYNEVGDILDLETADKTSIVEAINSFYNAMYFKPGDTFTYYFKTSVAPGAKLFRFQIPLNRPTLPGTAVTVTPNGNYQIFNGTNKISIAPSQISNSYANIQAFANCIEVTVNLTANPTNWNQNASSVMDSQLTVTFEEAE